MQTRKKETAVYVRRVSTSLINSQVYCSTVQHSRRIEGNLITSRFNTNGEKDTTDNWKNIRQKWQKLLGIIEEKFCHWYYKNQTAYSVRILYAWRYQPKPQDDTKKKKDKNQEPRYSKTGVPSTQYYGRPMDFSTDWNLGRRLISHQLGWTDCCIQ